MALFLFHYFNRALIYPWRIRGGKPTPLVVMLMALVFCLWNGHQQALYLTRFAPKSAVSARHVAGFTIFATGWIVNVHSDGVLRRLRKPGEVRPRDSFLYPPFFFFFLLFLSFFICVFITVVFLLLKIL
jgi:3-oxo-5-alpha-steroid 4-dehydrogenase 1